MKATRFFMIFVFLCAPAVAGCSTPASIPPSGDGETVFPPAQPTGLPAPASTATAAPTPTATVEPSPTLTPAPSLTPTPAILPLEIVEWAEFPYANLVDPLNTDTHVEMLVRNPNDFAVQLKGDHEEVRFLTATGEVVYANPNPSFYIFQGSWIRGGETVPISACVCFISSGLAKRPWERLELDVALEPASPVAYTTDVAVTLGESFSLAEAHLGGSGMGNEITLVNTSAEVLESFEVRVIARDTSGRYLGVVTYGGFSERLPSGGYARIEPGMSASGVIVSEVDYFDGPQEYEVIAIGILADP